jgi:hypothetical protein
MKRAAVLLLASAAAAAARAQTPASPIRVALGFGVDTAGSPEREVFALYRHYLTHRQDTIRPHPDWSAKEQQQWPAFDLLGSYIYQGFSDFTVVQLAPAAGLDSAFLLRTLISSVDDSTGAVRPLALYRVYAVREAGRWVLANALPRMTRGWRHDTIDPVTFVYPPTRAFDRSRAASAARFVDSLARAFELPVPAIGYYFTDDLIEIFRVLGLEFFPLASDTVGGRALTADRLVFIGSSSRGEDYRHELAHVVLQPLISRSRTAGLVMEGLMTWTGGSAGLDFHDLLPDLAAYVAAHPEITLRGILDAPPPRVGTLDMGYDGFAVLCDMIDGAGGVAALRDWLHAGADPDSVLGAAARLLHVPKEELDPRWRRHLATTAAALRADSAASAREAEIRRTWLRYLESKAPYWYLGSWQPSPYWEPTEQRRWRVYALPLAYLPDSARPEVLSVEPVSDSVYRIVTRFDEDSAMSPMRTPSVRMTVFAVRSGDGWVFSNALPRLTRTWRREAVGPITYVMEPGYPFNRARAERAVAFTDSVAAVFGVPRLQQLTYYLTSSEDEVYRIMGLETDIKWGPVGGVAQPTNQQLFSGIPAVGEEYRHELAHMVLLPLMGNTPFVASEGVPTWLGGTTGMDYRTAARGLARFLAEHPAVTLDTILTRRLPPPNSYAAAAVFVVMVFEQGGVDALKSLFSAGAGEEFRANMERLFSRPWPGIVADWRARALGYASP